MINHAYSANVILRSSFTKKDGTNPLVLRIIINRNVYDVSIGISVKPEHFDKKKQEINIPKKSKESHDQNLIIMHLLSRASDIFTEHRLMDIYLTVDVFRDCFENRTSRYDFIDFMKKEIIAEKLIREPSTINSYNQTAAWLKEYFKEGLSFADITPDNMDKFSKYLIRKKLAGNTNHKHKKNILKFINIAIRRGIRIKSPYTELKINKVPTNKDALTKEHLLELIKLYDEHALPMNLQNVLAMFLFSSICGGIRFSDLQKFSQENIIEDTLIFIPQKIKRFNRVVKVPIPEYAREFLNKARGCLFSKISNAKANEYLKTIQHQAEIPITLTTHVARHTFATLFLESDGEVHTLMEIMGIQKYETIKVYVHIANSRKKQSMAKYADFLQPKKVSLN